MLACIFPAANAAAVPGDIDGDSKATSADARLALRASVGLEQFSAAQKTSADVDFDGKITSADARLILRASVGLEKLGTKQSEKGSFGNVVTVNGNICFWKYNKNSFLSEEAIWGSYKLNPSAKNQLVCRTDDGKETVLLTTNGFGNLCAANGRLYYQTLKAQNYYSFGSTDQNYTICSCRYDGSDVRTVGDGVLAGIVENGKYLVYYAHEEDFDHFIYALNTSTGEKKSITGDNFLACGDKYIVCYTEDYHFSNEFPKSKATVYQVDIDGKNSKILYTNKASELDSIKNRNGYYSGVLLIHLAYSENNIIYYVFDHIDGTGIVTQSNQIIKIDLNTGTAKEISGGIYTELNSSFVDVTDPIPEGKVYENHLKCTFGKTALNKSDYSGFSSTALNYLGEANEGALNVEYSEEIGGKRYVFLSAGNLTGYVGWRYFYTFSKCAMYEKDMTTGKVTLIYSAK